MGGNSDWVEREGEARKGAREEDVDDLDEAVEDERDLTGPLRRGRLMSRNVEG